MNDYSAPVREGVQGIPADAPDVSRQPYIAGPVRHDERADRSANNYIFPLPIPEPPDDWKFNDLLTEIAQSVSGDELELFKNMFKGHGERSIQDQTLNECTTCIQLFTVLRVREYISRDNLLYLQKLLLILNNRDLTEKTIEYCRDEGKIHFYKEGDPVQGSRHVKFHVEGRDLGNLDQNILRDLRDRVAHIICLPPEDVVIVGVGPSSSFCITLMIPETYADILQAMLDRKQSFSSLCELNIDYIHIDGKFYNITGREEAELDVTEQQKKIKEIYEQYDEKSVLLDKAELEIISLLKAKELVNRDLEDTNKKLKDVQAELSNKRKLDLALTTVQEMQISVMHVDEEFAEFRQVLQQANIPETHRETIKRILVSNTNLVSSYTSKLRENEISKLRLDVNEQKDKALYLERQLEIQRFFSYRSVSEVNLLEKFRLCQPDITLEQFEKLVDTIKTISNDITEDERTKIEADCQWDNNGPINQDVENATDLFLIRVICGEYKKAEASFDIDAFITMVLNKVGRKDLIKTFKRLTREAERCHSIAGRYTTFTQRQYATEHSHGIFGLTSRILTGPAYPYIQHRADRTHQGTTFFDMVMRPIRHFVWRSVQTYHLF